MKGAASYLMKFLDGSQKRFIIPVYQRNYDWKKENCKQLFDDLVSVEKDGKETHFFGSIVSYAHSRDEVVLIDGQQRITTVSLILIAIVNALKKGAMSTKDDTLVFRIEDFLVDKYDRTGRKFRLKPFRDDRVAFDSLIYKDEADYIHESKVTINYRYFYDRIVTNKELSVDELFHAVNCLEIIDIELEPQHGDNPQLIFESLNSTGLDLTESDKIRNFVLMNLEPAVQESYYDKYWNKIEKCSRDELDGFVRNYLTVKRGVIPTLKGIYPAFKAYTKSRGDIESVLQDMLVYACAYQDVVSFNIGDDDANEMAKRLDLLDMTVAYPFLMAFVAYAKETGMDDKEICKVFSCVETFIFRRLMCGLPTNVLNKIFATLHSSVLKNKRDTDTYSSVMIYLLESRKLSSAFPKDEEFINGFTTKNVYSMRAKNKEYIFERLENGSSKEKNDVVGNIEKGVLTIEHIMPQTLTTAWKQALGEDWEAIQEKWLHTISNLTLTGYNSNYSNKSFLEKKTMKNGFIDSGIRLNHFIAQFDKWDEEELGLRKAKLSEMALEIWEYPVTSFVPEQKEDDIVSLSEDNGIATNRDIQYFIFREERQDVSTWSDMMWEMANKFLAMNPAILYQEAADDKNVWFATTAVSKNYRKLADSLYYCPTSSSTWNKMSILKNLFRLYGIDEDDLSFGLLPKKEGDGEISADEVGEPPARYELRKQFWTDFIQYCEENNGIFVKISTTTSNWISKSLKTPYGINVNAVVGFDYDRVEIYIGTKDKDFNKKLFDYLYAQKDAIEVEYGSTLIWERMSDKCASRIKDEITCHTFEMDDKTEVFEFMRSSAERMCPAFHKYILEFSAKEL
mgnify:CR=1 FL=1